MMRTRQSRINENTNRVLPFFVDSDEEDLFSKSKESEFQAGFGISLYVQLFGIFRFVWQRHLIKINLLSLPSRVSSRQ